jgi:hypothetical protein
VITRYRSAETNLRQGLRRIAGKAGVALWPRTFANLRASAEADLAEHFPLHVCAQWLGHSPRVALTNYLRARPEDYEKAAGGALQKVSQPGGGALHQVSQQGAERPREEAQTALRAMLENLANSLECEEIGRFDVVTTEPVTVPSV